MLLLVCYLNYKMHGVTIKICKPCFTIRCCSSYWHSGVPDVLVLLPKNVAIVPVLFICI